MAQCPKDLPEHSHDGVPCDGTRTDRYESPRAHDCEVCGDAHREDTHGEPETVLQPSLHSLEDYAELIFDEAEARGIVVSDLRAELDDTADEVSFLDEVTTDALDRIRDAGYPVLEADDTLLIYARTV